MHKCHETIHKGYQAIKKTQKHVASYAKHTLKFRMRAMHTHLKLKAWKFIRHCHPKKKHTTGACVTFMTVIFVAYMQVFGTFWRQIILSFFSMKSTFSTSCCVSCGDTSGATWHVRATPAHRRNLN